MHTCKEFQLKKVCNTKKLVLKICHKKGSFELGIMQTLVGNTWFYPIEREAVQIKHHHANIKFHTIKVQSFKSCQDIDSPTIHR